MTATWEEHRALLARLLSTADWEAVFGVYSYLEAHNNFMREHYAVEDELGERDVKLLVNVLLDIEEARTALGKRS